MFSRVISGQASSSTAEQAGLMASVVAELGWQIASNSNIPPNPTPSPTAGSSSDGRRNYSTMSSQNYSTSATRDIPGKGNHGKVC